MLCQKCGMQNNDTAKFCVKCGSSLLNSNNINNQVLTPNNGNINNQVLPPNNGNINNQVLPPNNGNINNQILNANNDNFNNQSSISNNINTQQYEDSLSVNMSIKDYFFVILNVILKPATAFKENLNKFASFKNSAILSLIISIISTLIILVKNIISNVRVTTGGFFSESETKWVWENIKDVQFFKIIGTNLLLILGVIFAISAIYYVAGLIAKKQSNFSRFLGISALSIIPILICSLLLSSIFEMLYKPLGLVVIIIGSVYTLVIFYETINNELSLENNLKYYLNFACLSILVTSGYYLYIRFFANSITNNIGNILDIFG